MTYRHATIIYNPASGRRRSLRERKVEAARRALQKSIQTVAVEATKARGDATRLAKKAVASGCDLVAVCGGDGTINEAVCGLVGSDSVLLTLPAGTANVLAEEVGLPNDPGKAAALLPELTPQPVPLGVLRYQQPKPGVRYFLLMCGVGVDASIVYHLNSKLKTYFGQGAYFLGSLEQLQRKFEPFQVRVDGREYEATFALISKSRCYGGGLVIAPQAHLLSNQFEVVIFQGESPLRYVGYLAQIATGTLDQFADVSFQRTDRVELTASDERRVYIEVDGELAGKLPAEVETAAERLTLLLPPQYTETARSILRGEESVFGASRP